MTFGYTKVEEEHKTLGMLTSWGGKGVTTDRLGSIRLDGNGGQYSYYPYGEVRTVPSGQTALFADLEDPVRVYDSNGARFGRPDPLGLKGVIMADPRSWNRFAYAMGDPVNGFDRKGLLTCFYVDGVLDSCEDDSGGGGGGGSDGMQVVNDNTSGGGGGGGSGYSQAGMDNAVAALKRLVGLNLGSNPCQADLQALAGEQALVGNWGAIGQAVSAGALVGAAQTILSKNYVYDGGTSSTVWNVSDFGSLPQGVPAFKGETIGDVFRLDPGIIALSQATGYAVWVNSAQWADLGSDYETGTILHEIIHKFGLNDGQMADALRVDIRQGSQSLSTKLMNDCVNQ